MIDVGISTETGYSYLIWKIRSMTILNIEWNDFVMMIELETHLRVDNCAL